MKASNFKTNKYSEALRDAFESKKHNDSNANSK
jgi:hypothetical protein